MRVFLARVERTSFQTATHDVKECLVCQRPIHRQDDARRTLLHEMISFDQTAVRITPPASNGKPMLHDHRHEFGVDLTEETHAFLAAPAIHLAILVPPLPDQLDLPADPQPCSSLSALSREAGVLVK